MDDGRHYRPFRDDPEWPQIRQHLAAKIVAGIVDIDLCEGGRQLASMGYRVGTSYRAAVKGVGKGETKCNCAGCSAATSRYDRYRTAAKAKAKAEIGVNAHSVGVNAHSVGVNAHSVGVNAHSPEVEFENKPYFGLSPTGLYVGSQQSLFQGDEVSDHQILLDIDEEAEAIRKEGLKKLDAKIAEYRDKQYSSLSPPPNLQWELPEQIRAHLISVLRDHPVLSKSDKGLFLVRCAATLQWIDPVGAEIDKLIPGLHIRLGQTGNKVYLRGNALFMLGRYNRRKGQTDIRTMVRKMVREGRYGVGMSSASIRKVQVAFNELLRPHGLTTYPIFKTR